MPTSSGFTDVKTKNALEENKFITGRLESEPGINTTPDINNKPLGVLLSQFESHGLDEINNASLMQRVDTKYLLPISDLERVLMLIGPSYTVLEIDSSRLFSYRNTYCKCG